MAFNYDNLWKMLVLHGMTKEDLRKEVGASPNTIFKLSSSESVPLDLIGRICDVLKCAPSDVMEYILEE